MPFPLKRDLSIAAWLPVRTSLKYLIECLRDDVVAQWFQLVNGLVNCPIKCLDDERMHRPLALVAGDKVMNRCVVSLLDILFDDLSLFGPHWFALPSDISMHQPYIHKKRGRRLSVRHIQFIVANSLHQLTKLVRGQPILAGKILQSVLSTVRGDNCFPRTRGTRCFLVTPAVLPDVVTVVTIDETTHLEKQSAYWVVKHRASRDDNPLERLGSVRTRY